MSIKYRSNGNKIGKNHAKVSNENVKQSTKLTETYLELFQTTMIENFR